MKTIWRKRLCFLLGILALAILGLRMREIHVPDASDAPYIITPAQFPQREGSVLARIIPEEIWPETEDAFWRDQPCLVVSGRVEEDLHETLETGQQVQVILAVINEEGRLPMLREYLRTCPAFYFYDVAPADEWVTVGGEMRFLENVPALYLWEYGWLPLTAEGLLDLTGLRSCLELEEGDTPFPEAKFGEDLADGEALRQLLLERSDPEGYGIKIARETIATWRAEQEAIERILFLRSCAPILCSAGILVLLLIWIRAEWWEGTFMRTRGRRPSEYSTEENQQEEKTDEIPQHKR